MIVFCTTCKNRTGHLKRTLPQNLQDNPSAKFVVVDYGGSDDDLLDWLKDGCGWAIASGRLTVFSYRGHPVFRMAHAKNMAHRLGMLLGGDILVNLDADNFAGEGFDDFVAEHFAASPRSFLWAHMVKGEMTRGISGRIAITSSAFHKVGGYDEEKFAEWGPDDKDFNLRLQAVGYEPVEIPRKFLNSVMHNARVRFKEYKHLRGQETDYFCMDKSSIVSAVANSGAIGLGRVFRNFDESDVVEIKPLPTRIFGIGLHKTATTSLHQALGILGYDSWHWLSAHSAKAIWRQMNERGYSPEVERYHALCDLPIPLLYKQLDAAYPRSKFIFTYRDPAAWLAAAWRHFSTANKFRRVWDGDPFTHRIHEVLYGVREFDADRMLARYLRHAAEVREYFAGRPDDFYEHHNKWGGLCEFLGVERPEAPFPQAYVSAALAVASLGLTGERK